MRLSITASFVFSVMLSVSCMGGGAADLAGSPPDPGGNVSFGGAQDIGELRGILDRGKIPGPDTFDANGFFNEHYNAAPPASCGSMLCVAAGMSVGRDWLAGAHQATLQLAVTSTVDPKTFQRLPMNLVVVVDHQVHRQALERLRIDGTGDRELQRRLVRTGEPVAPHRHPGGDAQHAAAGRGRRGVVVLVEEAVGVERVGPGDLAA